MTLLLTVPNFSEGSDPVTIARLRAAIARGGHAVLLDTHSDADHNRTVLTAAGGPGTLAQAVVQAAAAATAQIDIRTHAGAHPRVGAIDVAPIVYLDAGARGAAAAEALVLAARLADELALPVFLYGELTDHARTRADLRRGGPRTLAARIAAGELAPDFGPAALHPTAGAVLVACRPPLVAFNVELAPPATVDDARRIAGLIREGGREGIPSVRAIGVELTAPPRAQVSTNIEDHASATLATVLHAIARHAVPLRAETVGLPPRAAFDGFPDRVELVSAGPLEDALRRAVQEPRPVGSTD